MTVAPAAPRATPRRRPRLPLLAVCAVVGALAVAGCSSSSTDAAAPATSAGKRIAGATDESRSPAPSGQNFATGGARGTGILPANVSVDHSVIQQASLSVLTRQVAQALSRAESIVAGTGGFVADERTEANKRGDARYSTLTVRVPVNDFNSVLSELGALGTLQQQSRTAKDVTAEVVDVQSRVASAQASIKRIRLLLDRAQNLGDVISLESELSSRQADLEALEAQRAYYADQTALATIQLTLVSTPHVAPPPGTDNAGFLAGLSAGWRALLGFLTGLATGLGALLPFALLALLVAVPLWLLIKRMRPRAVAPVPAASVPTPAGE